MAYIDRFSGQVVSHGLRTFQASYFSDPEVSVRRTLGVVKISLRMAVCGLRLPP